MATIMVSKELGGQVVTREHGKRLRELVELHLSSPPLVIDFEGLQVTSVSFFDEAFGILARKMGESMLSSIRLEHMDPFDEKLLMDIVHSRAEEARKRSGRS